MRNTAPDAAPAGDAYRISLPAFQGPIGLLLSLIEERRLEITAISLAAVADQYLEHLQALRERNAAELAEFVEVAARLLVIKSRALLPSPASPDDDEEDVAGSLVQRLQEYRRFRWVARWLEERLDAHTVIYAREPAGVVAPLLILAPQSPARLSAAMRRLTIPATESAEDVGVVGQAVSLASALKLILRRLLRSASLAFADLIHNASSHSEMVATFLALLELVRRRRVQARQDALFATITITRPAPLEPPDAPQLETTEQVC